MADNFFELLNKYRELGLSPHPIKINEKFPVYNAWNKKDFEDQQFIYSEDEFYNVGLRLTGDWIVIDVDVTDKDQVTDICVTIEEVLGLLKEDVAVQKTASGRWHLLIKAEPEVKEKATNIIGIPTLHSLPELTKDGKHVIASNHIDIFINGDKYILSEPSIINGKQYKWIKFPSDTQQSINYNDYKKLIELMKYWESCFMNLLKQSHQEAMYYNRIINKLGNESEPKDPINQNHPKEMKDKNLQLLINQIKSLDIYIILENYLNFATEPQYIKPRYRQYFCPFHGDTKPSFAVRADGVVTDFHDNSHPDIITIVQKTLNYTFKEAIDWFLKQGLIAPEPIDIPVDTELKTNLQKTQKKDQTEKQKTSKKEIAEDILKKIISKFDGKETFVLDPEIKKWILLDSDRGINFIDSLFCDVTGWVGAAEITKELIRTIKTKAAKKGIEETPPKRSYWQDGVLYINAGDHIIEIDNNGYKIIEHNNIFLHGEFDVPNPKPQELDPDYEKEKEEILKILKHLTIQLSGKDRLIWITRLISMFIPDIQIPPLIYEGDPGSGKTTIAMYVKQIFDPTQCETMPRSENDMRNHALYYKYNQIGIADNYSFISASLSDFLCTLVTGGYTSERTLYTNFGMSLYSVKGSFELTTTGLKGEKDDLLDRSLKIKVKRIEPKARLADLLLKKMFKDNKPFILDFIYHTLSKSFTVDASIIDTIEDKPRFVDSFTWCYKFAKVMGKEADFLTTTTENKTEIFYDMLEKIGEPANIIWEQVSNLEPGESINGYTSDLSQRFWEASGHTGDTGWSSTTVGRTLKKLQFKMIDIGLQVNNKRSKEGIKWSILNPLKKDEKILDNNNQIDIVINKDKGEVKKPVTKEIKTCQIIYEWDKVDTSKIQEQIVLKYDGLEKIVRINTCVKDIIELQKQGYKITTQNIVAFVDYILEYSAKNLLTPEIKDILKTASDRLRSKMKDKSFIELKVVKNPIEPYNFEEAKKREEYQGLSDEEIKTLEGARIDLIKGHYESLRGSGIGEELGCNDFLDDDEFIKAIVKLIKTKPDYQKFINNIAIYQEFKHELFLMFDDRWKED